MSKFDIKLGNNGDKLQVKVVGVIDEDVDFTVYQLKGNQIEVDLKDLKSINSCGIREWIKWMGTAATSQISLHNCPKVIVDQINMVDGFLPANGKVQSFFVPYYSEEAGSEKSVLFSRGKEFNDGEVNIPAAVKDEDGNEMEMDVIESKYFKFITK